MTTTALFEDGSLSYRLSGDARIDFSFLISDVTRLMRQAFDTEMTEMGLTRSQWHALVYILRIGNPSQTELSGLLEMGRASTGALIDQLEKGGFVERRADENDRRVWRISPTKSAIAWAEEIAKLAELLANKVFKGLGSEDLEQAKKTMEAIRLNLMSK